MKIIPKTVTRKFGRQLLVTKKNSPHIFFAGGLVSVLGGTVLACRATLKLGDALDEFQEEIEGVKENLGDSPSYQRDLAYVYGKRTGHIIGLYAPAVIVTSVGVAALAGSHVQLTRRNAALTVAYAGIQKAYEEYRSRVRDEIGEERELDIYQDVSVVKKKDEDGKKIEVKVPGDPNKHSPYARFFDELSTEWQKDPELNRLFVQCQQNYANHLLHARGHVFLNEVYDMLGLERSGAGQIVGWVIGDDSTHAGDNYIDFGIFSESNNRFVNNMERSILLDFNVDGVVHDKI